MHDRAGLPRAGRPDLLCKEVSYLLRLLSTEGRQALLRAARIIAHSEGIISDEEAAGGGESSSQIAGIFSLGSHCYTSHILKEMGYRTEAGPFDWLFSDLRMVADCFDDRFAAFLNPAFYTYTGNPDGLGRGHLHYSPKYKRPVIFNHHDPLKPEHYQHFQRAVARIEEALDSGKRYLFVAVVPPARGAHENIDRLFTALRNRNATAELLVIVGSATAKNAPSSDWQGSRDGLHTYQVQTVSQMVSGLSHENAADDEVIKEIIRLYAQA